MSMRPVVDRIEREYQGRLDVLRVNAQDDLGALLSARFDLRGTPTFLLFDSDGDEVLRSVGVIDPRELARELEVEP
jgi:thiol-disulfide isomerase/thioredoxin